MKLNKHREKTMKAWTLRALIGPAHIVDGIFSTVSIGFISAGCALFVSRHLAKTRVIK